MMLQCGHLYQGFQYTVQVWVRPLDRNPLYFFFSYLSLFFNFFTKQFFFSAPEKDNIFAEMSAANWSRTSGNPFDNLVWHFVLVIFLLKLRTHYAHSIKRKKYFVLSITVQSSKFNPNEPNKQLHYLFAMHLLIQYISQIFTVSDTVKHKTKLQQILCTILYCMKERKKKKKIQRKNCNTH